MQNLKIQMTDPGNPVMNVRMATNFPKNDIIANPPAPPHQPKHIIRPGKTVMVFSGSDKQALLDQAALSYRVAALRRTSLCAAFGGFSFIQRLEANLPSGSILMGVSGSQGGEEKRQELFCKFAENDPFIFLFEDLSKSQYQFVARRAFHSSFASISTIVAESKQQVFEILFSMVIMTEKEKQTFSWTEIQRAKLITVIHNDEDISEEFYAWFTENQETRSAAGLQSVDATGFVDGVTGTA